MGTRIGIIGVGAIGSIAGGLLTKAGHDVTLIDQWPAIRSWACSRSNGGHEPMKLTRRALMVGLIGVLAYGCVGEKSPVTADNARKVTKGMGEGEVMGLLGRPAQQVTQSLPPPMNVTGALWTFKGPEDRVEVVFEENKVTVVRLNGTPILE